MINEGFSRYDGDSYMDYAIPKREFDDYLNNDLRKGNIDKSVIDAYKKLHLTNDMLVFNDDNTDPKYMEVIEIMYKDHKAILFNTEKATNQHSYESAPSDYFVKPNDLKQYMKKYLNESL